MADFEIELILKATPEIVEPIGRLLGQLTSAGVEFDMEALRRITASESSHLFLLRTSEVAGMLTLGTYYSPTGRKVWVEDVVVDSKYRGQGLGRALIAHAIEFCRKRYAPCNLMLTSNPARIAANELYRSSGFEPKQTNVYRMMIE